MVIDLGEPQEEIELSARPWSSWQRRAVSAAAVLAALLGAGAAAAPVRPELLSVTIQATAADRYVVQEDALYLLRLSRGSRRLGTVTRYRLADPVEPEWETAINNAGPLHVAYLFEGMLLIKVGATEQQTIAIQPDTGREVWRRPGWYIGTGPGHGLFHDQARGITQHLSSVELATGNVRWSRSFPPQDPVLIDRNHGDRFVRWTKSGTAQLYDADAGALLATAHLPFDPESTARTVGGLLLIPGRVGSRWVVTAYGLDHLDRRWQTAIDFRGEHLNGGGYSECGAALCVGNINEGGVRLLDRATGRTRWSAPGSPFAWLVGPHLLTFRPGTTPVPRMVLLNPADGHLVADLGEWFPSAPADDGQMLAIRETGPRTLVARLDPTAMNVDVLGALANVFECEPYLVTVVCRRTGGAIAVWYPRRKP
jgi:hypothetical protein